MNCPDYSSVEALYRDHRYLDAFELIKDVLKDNNQDWSSLNARQLLVLGRLSGRLGGSGLMKSMYQAARDKYPGDPLVLFYAGRSEGAFQHSLFQLKQTRSFQVENLETGYDRAIWYAGSACLYAKFRSFSKAFGLIEHAKSQNEEPAWVRTCEAEIYYLSDQWNIAKEKIDDAWAMLPGHPQTASTLGQVYAKLGLIRQAAQKILEVAVKGQSYQTLILGLWYLGALAERKSGKERVLLANKADCYANNLNRLAPLADSEVLGTFADLRIDIAWLKNDADAMQRQIESVTHPFYKTILENQAGNPGKPFFQAPYKVVYQKHNTCLPASTAAVLGGLGKDLDVDALARKMTYQGTSIWRMCDWLKKEGYCVKPFIATPCLIRELLKNRCAFVFIQKTVGGYHAMAATGWDEASDVLFLHDPSSIRMERILMEKTGAGQAPFGPEALAISTKQDRTVLDIIPKAASDPFIAFLEYNKSLATKGYETAGEVLTELKKIYPRHPFTYRLESIHLGHTGRPGQAIKIQKALLEKFPACDPLKDELLLSLQSTGNSALQRSFLAQWVKQKKLPGIKAREAWRYPPAEYVARYADFFGMDQSGFEPSVKMLWKALRREPFHAGAYHILGDIHTRAGNFEKSILPYYCAAHLELENHHYARAYSDALHKVGQGRKGLDFLKARVDRLKDTIGTGSVWAEFINALEAYGFPGEAVDEMDLAGSRLPEDPGLHGVAVQFWGRMGFRDKARQSLACVEKFGTLPAFYSAQINYLRQAGDWKSALSYARKWQKEEPDNLDCLRSVADLASMKDGRAKGLALTCAWMEKFRGNDFVENLHYDYLSSLFKDQEKLQLLRERIRRNPYDGWAHRELGLCLLNQLTPGQKSLWEKNVKELGTIIERCRKICPDHPGFYILMAETKANDNDIDQAVRYAVNAFELDPEYVYAYRQAWEWACNYPDEKQKRLFSRMEKSLFRCPGFLSASRDIIFLYARRFGVKAAHEVVDNWCQRLPNDPELVEAKADLLLEYGQGRSDAGQALQLLETQIVRFPNYQDLYLSLAQAHRILLNEDKWLKVTKKILDRFPLNSHIRCQVAAFYRTRGQTRDALELLKKGIELKPMDEDLRFDYIVLLFQSGAHDAAKNEIRSAMAFMPECVYFRRTLVDLLFDYGEDNLAVDLAGEGVKVYPEGSVLWLSLAMALWRSRFHTDMEMVESYFRKALKYNPAHFDAADSLSEFLGLRQRYEDARKAIETQKSGQADPGLIETRLAWITRQEGEQKKAKTQLVRALELYPRNHWGWRMLLEWITEDKDWDLAREILKKAPPLMLEAPDFTADKLMLLNEAGLEDDNTEDEWHKILENFPENERIYTQRYDLLWEKKELDRAGSILETAARFHPDSPYILARKASFSLARDQTGTAFKAALAAWRMPGGVSDWCQEHIWDAFKEKGCLKDLLETVLKDWENGEFLEPGIFRMVVNGLDEVYDISGWKYKILGRLGFSDPLVSRLNHLLTLAPEKDTPDGYYTYSLLDKLDSMARKKQVIRFSKTHKKFCLDRTQVWQIVGHALLTGSERNNVKARRWFSIWERQDGCDLWAVSNYIISIEGCRSSDRREAQQLIYESCEKAVRILPRDHTFQYMVAKQCQAALRLGMDEQFLACSTRFKDLLADTDSGYWLAGKDQHLPRIILLFNKLLQSRNQDETRDNAKEFIAGLPEVKELGWIRTAFLKQIKPHVGFWAYLNYWCRLSI